MDNYNNNGYDNGTGNTYPYVLVKDKKLEADQTYKVVICGAGKEKPPALSEKMSQKKDSSKSEVHNSLSSQTQEMQSTSKRGIMDKKSVSKQPQAEKQNPQRPNVNKTQDKQESKDKERQSNGSATKGAAPVHERPATTPVPVKSDTKAAASKQVQNVKERPVTVSKEQPQSSRTKEPVTKPQENIRTQVVRESSPAGKQTSSVVSKHSGTATDGSRQTVQLKRRIKKRPVPKRKPTIKKRLMKKRVVRRQEERSAAGERI